MGRCGEEICEGGNVTRIPLLIDVNIFKINYSHKQYSNGIILFPYQSQRKRPGFGSLYYKK